MPIPTYLKVAVDPKDPNGPYNTIVNPLKDYVRPYWLNTDDPNTQITVAAGGTSAPFAMTVGHEAHFEGAYFIANRTNPVTIFINYPGKRMNLMNREIHMDTIARDGDRPFILSETLWIPAIRNINVTFRDLGPGSDVRFSIHGRRWYHYEAPQDLAWKIQDYAQRRERSSLYFLTTDDPVVLAANQTLEFTASIPDDGDFEWFKSSFVSTGAFTLRIRDAQTGRELMNGPVRQNLLAGDGNFPFILFEPYLVRRSLRLRLEFTDLTGAPNTIFWTMTGRRIYYETREAGY